MTNLADPIPGIDNPALVLDLLEWLQEQPRGYREVLESWRSTCPRLTIWEDAVDAGLVSIIHAPGRPAEVRLSAAGRGFIEARRR